MGKFRELTIDEATNISGGTFEDMAEIIASINNGTYVGGSLVYFDPCTGFIASTADIAYGSPAGIFVNGEQIFAGTPRWNP